MPLGLLLHVGGVEPRQAPEVLAGGVGMALARVEGLRGIPAKAAILATFELSS